MATSYNPKITTGGLILGLDAANRKSYIGSGTAWNDLSGNNNSVTLVNGPTFNTSNAGNIVFDGTNDNGTFGTTFGNGLAAITVQVWFRPTVLSTSFTHIVGVDDNSSGGAESVFLLTVDRLTAVTHMPSSYIGTNVAFGVRTTSQTAQARARPIHVADVITFWPEYLQGMAIVKNPAEYALNTWMCVTGVYNGTNTLMYINGVLRGSSVSQPDGINRSITGNLNTSAMTRTIAMGSTSANYFSGNLSQILIYNRALSASEVLNNYNVTRSRFGV